MKISHIKPMMMKTRSQLNVLCIFQTFLTMLKVNCKKKSEAVSGLFLAPVSNSPLAIPPARLLNLKSCVANK